MSRFLRRLLSAAAMWIIALFVIFSGNEILFLCLVGALGLGGLWEYFRMIERSGMRCFKAFGMICGATYFIGSTIFFRTNNLDTAYDFETAVVLIFLFGVFARQMFRPTTKRDPLETMAYTLFGLLYVAWLFNFMTKIVYVVPRNADGGTIGQYYVLYLVAVTKFSDMGAYLVGSRIGRHQMIPHISPAKTWEGFAGSLVFAVLGSFLILLLLPTQLAALDHFHATILGLLLGFAAVVGDLGESIIKRSAGVKDSGSVLPGIGGMLDLIDSLLFTAPLLFFYLRFLVR
jgi:phosphatidate cytidylyltransferase